MKEWFDSVHIAWKIGLLVATLLAAVWGSLPARGANGHPDPHIEQTRVLHEINKNLAEIKGILGRR